MDIFKRGQHSTEIRTNLISLWGWAIGSNGATLRRTNGSQVGYQVPVGKILIITRLMAGNASDAGSTASVHVFYSDTDAGLNGGLGTNPVRVVGTGATNQTPFHHSSGPLSSGANIWPCWMEIPALKYPGIQMGSGQMGVFADGYLVDA